MPDFNKEYDVYRDSYWRYLGYANEVGEAFRPLVPRSLVTASYAIATTYVCADVADKALKTHKSGAKPAKVAITAGDVFLWQMLASVILPGFTINRITWATGRLLKYAKATAQIKKITPTAVGLISIPFIIQPIDHLVDEIMDKTYRKFFT